MGCLGVFTGIIDRFFNNKKDNRLFVDFKLGNDFLVDFNNNVLIESLSHLICIGLQCGD